ncbi:MAG: nicotinamide mononucleotide transporter [Bacteroidales bacterium]|nr:nicotinamide mononucleotide transporter [Bacteroidales bacterium]
MNIFEIIGAVIGLFYIVSEYRADRWFWPLSLLMSAFYAVIDFTSGIYANGAICVYNFIMSIYGILVWRGVIQKRTADHGGERHISSCPRRYWWQIITVTVLLSALLTWLLGYLHQSTYTLTSGHTVNLSLLDGISSALTIVAMVMLAHKWWQQWFLWLLVEPLMITIFLLTGNYASAVLYAVFEVFCILGILHWRKESLKQSDTQQLDR